MKQENNPALKFVVCINAAADGDLRVIDESGEDYLYSADRFVPISVPEAVQKSLLKAA